jgi:hypothetical protein
MNKIYIEPASSERDHRKLEALGRKLGIPVPMAFLEMEVTMPAGKTLTHFKQRSHSWTRIAYNAVFSALAAVFFNDVTFGAGKVSLKDNGGTVRSQAGFITMYTTGGYTGTAGSNINGIVVGTDATAESFEDYHLLAIVANGSGAGQLTYSASEPVVVTYDAPSKTLTATHVRYFNNNNAAAITIKEVGLTGDYTNNEWRCLPTRDHIADVVIPATGQLKVSYAISLVYPA